MNMTRRDFLTTGAVAVGGIAATSALPALADDPSLFPKRGRYERLSLQSYEIKAGATKPFSVLHISDTHLTAAYDDESAWVRREAVRRARTFGGRQEEALRDSIAWAKVHNDYLVHTGDLIDMFSRANIDLVKKYFGNAGGMVLNCPGNHEYYRGRQKDEDGDAKDREVAASLAQVYPSAPQSLSSSVLNGVNFLMLDNSKGIVTAEQASRVEKEFKKGLPAILCMHCSFPTYNVVRASKRFWRSKGNLKHVDDMRNFKERYSDPTTREFVAYLRAQPLLKAILSGHGHVGVVDSFSPTASQYQVAGNFLFHGQEMIVT